jgi:apolipoprotein N-acyltransferase
MAGMLTFISWTQPQGEPFQVSLVQANIPQQLKWLPEQLEPTLNQYKALSQNHWDSQLVIWPEAAIPAALNDVPEFVNEMTATAREHHALLITGIPIKNIHNNHYFNAVISVGNVASGFYLKHHLVPFSEYIPLQKLLGRVFDFLQIPMSDLIADHGLQKPLTLANGIQMLTFICYEIAFPEQVLYPLKNIGLILTVTNDAWFGHSIAQAQHLQMASMRALETGRPVLFASNNGITALISAKGKLLSTAPPFETYVLTGKIQAYTGMTPWQRYTMDPILLILASLLYFAFRYRKAPKNT